MSSDFYQELGVSREASAAEIRSAYRKLAMKFHPDRNPDNEEAADRFKKISEAYAILSDPQKKQQYDMGGFRNDGGFSGDFSDVFSDLFSQFGSAFQHSGRQNRHNSPVAGDDMEYVLEISLEEALSGAKKNIQFPATDTCTNCGGKGHEKDGGPEDCSHCDGQGQTRVSKGLFFMSQTCRRCGGSGQTFKNPCKTCGGRGVRQKKRKLEVNIPAGIAYGQSLRLTQQGGKGLRGGPDGDLYIRIKVKEHPLFVREDNDLITDIPLTFAQVTLGDKIKIKAPSNSFMLTIPPGLQSGQVLRIAGHGAPSLGGRPRGDLLCRIQVQTPENLNKEQKQLLKDFDQSLPENKRNRKWHERISEFFKQIA
ncbi:MAG: molecular chaperone DnaJ [Gammaproteobacteria bacterium]